MEALSRSMKSRIGFNAYTLSLLQTAAGQRTFTAWQYVQQALQEHHIKLLLAVLLFRLEADRLIDKILQFSDGR